MDREVPIVALAAYQNALSNWWATVDPVDASVAFVLLIVVIIFRKTLANWIVAFISKYLANLTGSEGLGEHTTKRMAHATRVLIVALSCLVLANSLALPEFTGGVVRKVIATAAIIAVFTTWYELAGSFVSILKTGEFKDVALEADWTTRVTQFAIFIFGLAAVLNVWQIDISGALTGVGVLGAGVAIAAQDLVRNLIAGMTNQSEDRFATGDAIEIEGQFAGVIKKIDIRSTQVLGFDQVPRHVPNAELSNSVVKNYSKMRHRRVLLSVPLVLSSSLEQIEAVRAGLEAYMTNSGDFLLSDDAPTYVHVSGVTDSAVEVMFYALTKSGAYDEYLAVVERISEEILTIVAGSGTRLAYPTQTIFLQSDKTSSAAGAEPN